MRRHQLHGLAKQLSCYSTVEPQCLAATRQNTTRGCNLAICAQENSTKKAISLLQQLLWPLDSRTTVLATTCQNTTRGCNLAICAQENSTKKAISLLQQLLWPLDSRLTVSSYYMSTQHSRLSLAVCARTESVKKAISLLQQLLWCREYCFIWGMMAVIGHLRTKAQHQKGYSLLLWCRGYCCIWGTMAGGNRTCRSCP